MLKTVPIPTIQFSISTHFKCKYGLIVKNFLFQTIQFSQTILIQTIQFKCFFISFSQVILYQVFLSNTNNL